MYHMELCRGAWVLVGQAAYRIAPTSYTVNQTGGLPAVPPDNDWAASLKAAWEKGLETLRSFSAQIDAADLDGVETELQAAARTLETIESLRALGPNSSRVNISRLAVDTVDALTEITYDRISEKDPVRLLIWMLSQDSQLQARVESWSRCNEPALDRAVRVHYEVASGAVVQDSLDGTVAA